MENSRLSLLSAAGLLVAAGIVAQFAHATPSILTGSDKSMEQYESFRIHVERDGPYDLIVFGNSVARQAVAIPQLTAELGRDRGEPLRAYNFGVGGTQTPVLSYMIDLAYGVDRPRYAVILLTRRMAGAWTTALTERVETLHSSPYGEALRDPVRWRGALRRWLLDHVSIFGLRYRLKATLLREETVEWTPGGYDPGYGFKIARRQGEEEPDWEEMGDKIRAWSITKEKVRVLADVVRQLQALGVEVWLAEAPAHPQFLALLRDGGDDRMVGRIAGVLREIAEETGAHALLLPKSLRIPADEFRDKMHTNARGAARYTEWLAGEIELDAASRR